MGIRFVRWYNTEHRHSGLAFLTPTQRHQRLADEIFESRKQAYEAAKAKNPNRWFGNIRNWSLEE